MYSHEAYASYEASSRLDTGVFVDVLTLIWSILVVKCISKILVDNGFNHGMGCLFVLVNLFEVQRLSEWCCLIYR